MARSQPGGSFIGSDGTRLRYWSHGKGPPLLCANGLACDTHFWRFLTARFQRDHRVILWDYPGHGLSPPPLEPDALRVEALADDMIRLLDRLRLRRAVLLGHSMGVQVILEAAHRHPDRVAGLVPICGAYGHPGDYFLHTPVLGLAMPAIQALGTAFPRSLGALWRDLLRSPVVNPLAFVIGVNRRLVNLEDLAAYLKHLTSLDLEVLLTTARHAFDHTAEPWLPELEHPAMVVAGSRDHFTPYWLSLRLCEALPDAELLTIPEGSHVAHIEMPRLVMRRLRKFLIDRVPRRGQGWRR